MAKLGIKCKLYRNTNTWASPTWSEVKCLRDLTQNVTWGEVEAATRGSRVTFTEKTMLGLSWEVTVQKGDANDATNLAAILAAIPADTVLDLMFLDGPSTTNGVVGYRCECKLFSGTEDQGPQAVLYPNIRILPSPPSASGQIPQSVLVSGGSAAFTDLAA